MVKILVCDQIDEATIQKLSDLGHEVLYKTGMDEEELAKTIPPYEVAIVRSATKITERVIDAASNLKLVIRGGVGVDNIAVDYASEKGIAVRNTPGASSVAVAELVLGLMLTMVREIPHAWSSMKLGKWEKKRFKGRELYEKTLGLIGCGRIGAEVAKRALAFGMRVVVYDPYVRSLPEGVEGELVSLETLFKVSDFISLHTPLNEQTRHLIRLENIEKMKDGVYIVNCARGPVVNEKDILIALNEGKVAGYGVDVFEKEPTDNLDLVKHPDVYPTPHIGASTREAQQRVGQEIVTIIDEFFKG